MTRIRTSSPPRAPWPAAANFAGIAEPDDAVSFDLAVACWGAINKAKADAAVSMGREVEALRLAAEPATLERLTRVARDVLDAARVARHEALADATLEPGAFAVREARFAPKPDAD